MKEQIIFVLMIAILLAGFFSSTMTGESTRPTIRGKSDLLGANDQGVGEREYIIKKGRFIDPNSGSLRRGYSLLFNNPFPADKGDLNRNGMIDKDDLRIANQIAQRATDTRTSLPNKRGIRQEYVYQSKLAYTENSIGIYDSAADFDEDGDVDHQDLNVLRDLLNPFMSVKTSIMSNFVAQTDCAEIGSQTCNVEGKLGTCKEVIRGGGAVGLLHYEWKSPPGGTECVVTGHGTAEFRSRVIKQRIYGSE